MIESIITDYLGHNRRLVIPGLGAFLKKEDGQTVFVPFLNKDDGILSGLVRQTYGTSTDEAEGIIAQYVDTVREGVESHGAYRVSPLGSLKKDDNGILYLDTADLTAKPNTPAPAAAKESPAPQPEIIEEPLFEPEPVVVTLAAPTAQPQPAPEQNLTKPLTADTQQTVGETVDAPKTINDLIREKQEEKEAAPQTVHSRMAEERKPEPPRPPVTTPRPQPVAPPPPQRPTPAPAPQQRTPAPSPAPQRKSPPTAAQKQKRGDIILILAVVVAVLAVAAMIYAYAVVDLPLFNLK